MFGDGIGALFQSVLGLHGWPVYAVVLTLAFLESAAFVGLVLPGETALLLGGLLASRGNISLGLLLPLAVAAAVGGDSVGYLIGRHFGPVLRRSRLGRRIPAEHWDRAERAVEQRGMWAIIAGRWVGVLRALVPTMAGMTRMPYRRFLVANVVGGAGWAVGVVLLGYGAGSSIHQMQRLLGNISLALAAAAALVVAVLTIRAVARRRRSQAAAGEVTVPARRGAGERIRQVLALNGWTLTALAVSALGTLSVLVLADAARERDGLAALDPTLAGQAGAVRGATLTAAAQVLTTLGSEASLTVLSLLAAATLAAWTRSWRPVSLVAAVMGGSAVLTVLVKTAVARPRPGPVYLLGAPESSFSFPSGHTLNTTVFFGLIAGLALLRTRGWLLRSVILLAWLTVSAGVGLSRIYLGYHWGTDVAAGWLLGISWLAVAWAAARWWHSRSRSAGLAG